MDSSYKSKTAKEKAFLLFSERLDLDFFALKGPKPLKKLKCFLSQNKSSWG